MKLTLKDYQVLALQRLNPNIIKTPEESMRFCCMGLLEETGEVVSELRKPLYKGNFHEKKLDKEAIMGEIGDLIWYIAFACRNNKINIEKLEEDEIEEESEEDREKIIDNSLKLGKQSGKIVRAYLKYHDGKIKKEKLEKALRKQYKNIIKLAGELNLSMDSILINNIEKCMHRYDKNGIAKNNDGDER